MEGSLVELRDIEESQGPYISFADVGVLTSTGDMLSDGRNIPLLQETMPEISGVLVSLSVVDLGQ